MTTKGEVENSARAGPMTDRRVSPVAPWSMLYVLSTHRAEPRDWRPEVPPLDRTAEPDWAKLFRQADEERQRWQEEGARQAAAQVAARLRPGWTEWCRRRRATGRGRQPGGRGACRLRSPGARLGEPNSVRPRSSGPRRPRHDRADRARRRRRLGWARRPWGRGDRQHRPAARSIPATRQRATPEPAARRQGRATPSKATGRGHPDPGGPGGRHPLRAAGAGRGAGPPRRLRLGGRRRATDPKGQPTRRHLRPRLWSGGSGECWSCGNV